LQIEISRVSRKCDEIDKENMKHILQQLQIQRRKWCPHNRNALCWSFYCVIDTSKVNMDALQMMHCLLCHSQPIVSMNSKKKLLKERSIIIL
jgi:hypothetical protein